MTLRQAFPSGSVALISFAICSVAVSPSWAQQDVITTAIGGGPNNTPAVNADVHLPIALAISPTGDYYVAANNQNRVFRVDTSGKLTVYAGNGVAGETGDGVTGGAAQAELNAPAGVALDSAGNLYISDYTGCVVRKIDTTQTITTVAGTPGSCGFAGDGGSATSAKLDNPRGLRLDTSGNLYIADYDNCRVREVALATGTITTYAGSGSCSYSGDGGAAIAAGLSHPTDVAVDTAGDLFISSDGDYRIREVSAAPASIITTIAGTGSSGSGCPTGTATATTVGQLYGLIVDPTGSTVTFADYTHDCVRQFTVGGAMSNIAGKSVNGFCGDGGLATAACFYNPTAVVMNASSTYYVADYNNYRVRAFTIGGNISTVAGNGNTTFPTLVSGEPANGVVFNSPYDILEDPSANTFVSEYSNCIVREFVKSTGDVNIFAGSAAANAETGTCGFTGFGGPATSAELGNVAGVARDSSGNVYIVDSSNCVVWEVSASTGDISIFAGVNPKACGYNGDNIAATSAELHSPSGIAIDNQNNVYIADNSNNRVREISGGVIHTIAGNGTAGYAGDGDPAISAELNTPSGVAVDTAGNVYIADYNNCVVREVMALTGLIFTIAGNHTCNFNGDGIATEHELYHPSRVHVDANENLFVSDYSNDLVRWINPEGIMTTIAGTPDKAGLSGDGGLATSAELNEPIGITQDLSGNYLIVDNTNMRVREVTAFAALNMSTSTLGFGLAPVGGISQPQVITLSALGTVAFSNISISGPFTEADDCTTLTNAQTCSIYVTFQPTAAGTQTGSISILDNGFFYNSATISLQGTGTAISVTGGPLAFGSQAVGTKSAAKTVTVTNRGTTAVTFGAITVDDADFVDAQNTCPAAGSTLAAGAKCTVSLIFKPRTTGFKKGALVINDSDPSSPQIVGLSGTGTSLVTLTPNTIAFPTQAVGTVSSLTKVTLTNNTGVSLTLGRTALSVTGPFTISSGATFCTNGLVIPAGGTCFIYLEFAPTATGYPTGTLSVTDSDPTSPQTVALSGTATGILFNPAAVSLSGSVGHQVSTAVSIENVGTSTITFSAQVISGPNAKDFSSNLTDPPCSGTFAAGAFCNFTLYFTPSLVGSESATLSVYDNSPGSPQTLPLSGTGQ